MSDKIAAERDFHLHTMKETIERMKAELMAASDAAHKMKEHDDPNMKDLDRTMELGSLVDGLVDLCGPHLRLLNHIVEALATLEADQEGAKAEPVPRH